MGNCDTVLAPIAIGAGGQIDDQISAGERNRLRDHEFAVELTNRLLVLLFNPLSPIPYGGSTTVKSKHLSGIGYYVPLGRLHPPLPRGPS